MLYLVRLIGPIIQLTGNAKSSVPIRYISGGTEVKLARQTDFRGVDPDFMLPESTVVTLLLLVLMENEDLDDRVRAIDPDAESTSDSGSWKFSEGVLVLLPREDGESYIRVGSFHHLCRHGFNKPLFTGNADEERQVLLY